MEKEKYLFKVKKSRKIYLWVYLLILIIVGSLIYFYSIGYNIDNFVLIPSMIFIFLIIVITEFNHMGEWWAVTKTQLVKGKGIFNRNVGSIDFLKISDLEIDQPFYKILLNYGTINVRVFSKYMPIKNINSPGKFLGKLQKLVSDRVEPKETNHSKK